MSYEYGASSGVFDILDKIRVVAIARGWGVHNYSSPAANTSWLVLQVGDNYFSLLASLSAGSIYDKGNFIYGCMCKGFNAGADWQNQPGTSYKTDYSTSNTACNQLLGPFTSYRIFSGPTFIHVVIETSPGVFSHIAMGQVNKYGSYVGGGYISMSNWYTDPQVSSNVANTPDSGNHAYLFDTGSGSSQENISIIFRADVDAKSYFYSYKGQWTGSTNLVTGLIRGFNPDTSIVPIEIPNSLPMARTPNDFNLVTPLLHSVLYVSRGAGLYSPVGEVPEFRVINMKNYNAGDIVTLGADEWVVIPAKSKTLTWNNSPSQVPSSANYGYAFKKVA